MLLILWLGVFLFSFIAPMTTFKEYLSNLSKSDLIQIIYNKNNVEFARKSYFDVENLRTIALKICYNGKEYKGVQKHPLGLSVSEVLNNAILRSGISIPENMLTFCGRTDAGVSAVGMIVTLIVKSNKTSLNNLADGIKQLEITPCGLDNSLDTKLSKKTTEINNWNGLMDHISLQPENLCKPNIKSSLHSLSNTGNSSEETSQFISNLSEPKTMPETRLEESVDSASSSNLLNGKSKKYHYSEDQFKLKDSDFIEYPYDRIINKYLPDKIRIKGWAPVPDNFNARHSCRQRHYKYYFICKEEHINRYQEAGAKIKEMTNFYKLSKHSNPRTDYNKSIDDLTISKVHSIDLDRTKVLACMDIKAYCFLHNMVRKIFTVIDKYAKGFGLQLDHVHCANPENLVFYDAKFDFELNFITSSDHESNQFKRTYEQSIIEQEIHKLNL